MSSETYLLGAGSQFSAVHTNKHRIAAREWYALQIVHFWTLHLSAMLAAGCMIKTGYAWALGTEDKRMTDS